MALVNNGFEVVSDPDRPELGRFLRATRHFERGELVLRELPLARVTVTGRKLQKDASAFAGALRAAELFVPPSESPVVSRLRKEAPNGEDEDTLFVRTVLHFNSFAAGACGRDKVTFATLARANHSCAPNCIVDGDEGTLRTLQAVETGDLLFISYLDEATLLRPRDARRVELADSWDFTCRCSRCESVDSSGDDVRRFRGCRIAGCDGDLLLVGTDAPSLRCVQCSASLAPREMRAMLDAEAAAERSLSRALSGNLEEEDEGAELMRCYKFAKDHPLNAAALRLATDFAFPDAVLAKQAILRGLRVVFGDLPCQLAVDTGRELADLLLGQGDRAGARTCLKNAAEIACILDGRSDPNVLLEEWQKAQRSARRGPLGDNTRPPESEAVLLARELDFGMDKSSAGVEAKKTEMQGGCCSTGGGEQRESGPSIVGGGSACCEQTNAGPSVVGGGSTCCQQSDAGPNVVGGGDSCCQQSGAGAAADTRGLRPDEPEPVAREEELQQKPAAPGRTSLVHSWFLPVASALAVVTVLGLWRSRHWRRT